VVEIVEPGPLRILLFLSLALRRANLELLKRRDRRPAVRPVRVGAAKVAKGGVQVFLAVQTLCLAILPIAESSAAVRLDGMLLFGLGVLMTIASRRTLGDSWVDLEEATILPGHKLVTRGVYRYVRHPIYTADVLLFIGLQLCLNSWLVLAALALVPILVWRVRHEERQLSAAFPGYDEYRSRTKRFIPFLY
jgi:protein-S-isoprenylcysteine O-methyltransferase Ste14